MGQGIVIKQLWYPQLDVFDGVRRLTLLLMHWHATEPSLERLYVADFYFANPPLLHKTSMTMAVRKSFRKLSIANPKSSFLSYPTSPLLFQRMEPIQKQAVHAMVGKGILSAEKLRLGSARLTNRGMNIAEQLLSRQSSKQEIDLLHFLVQEFCAISSEDNHDFRRRSRLRRTT